MTENEFWKIIDKLDWKKSDNDDSVVAPVVAYLSAKGDEAIYQFEELMAQKLHALDTEAHAIEIGEGAYINDESYFSVDGFLYSRCVVVANGKEVFDQVLLNPNKFPKDLEFEAILYVARKAYEKTNNKKWDYVTATSYETFKNASGW